MITLWFLAVIVAIARAWQAREPRATPLSPEARNQFALRQAMLRYRSIFTQSIGRRPPEPDAPEARRREMA